MIRVRLLLAALALPIVLAGCGATAEPEGGATRTPATSSSTLAEEFGDADVADLVEELEATSLDERRTDLVAQVRTDAVVLSRPDGGEELRLPLETEKAYVSVAPYGQQTHECHFHSLTTCVGELGDTPVRVTVTDTDTGEVVLEESRRTAENGFLGLWLPRRASLRVEMVGDAGRGTVEVSTDDAEDATCVTTLQLA